MTAVRGCLVHAAGKRGIEEYFGLRCGVAVGLDGLLPQANSSEAKVRSKMQLIGRVRSAVLVRMHGPCYKFNQIYKFDYKYRWTVN
jgi:hypothetical protein